MTARKTTSCKALGGILSDSVMINTVGKHFSLQIHSAIPSIGLIPDSAGSSIIRRGDDGKRRNSPILRMPSEDAKVAITRVSNGDPIPVLSD